jgi:Carboxypeptidase regulatory-like domain
MIVLHLLCRVFRVVYHIRMSVQSAAMVLLATVFIAGAARGPDRQDAWSERSTLAYQTTQPARKPNPASVSGTVTSDGAALSRARVILRSAALPQQRITMSDGEGAFTIGNLPPGDYDVVVIRSGYALSASSVTLRLGDGEDRRGFNIALQRAGTIPGRITDEDGTPMANAEVEALSLRVSDPRQTPLAVASSRTDDRGEFRLTGLPAGQYFIVARDPAFNNVGDESGALRYAPTYYPGALAVAEAQPVSVTAGRDSSRVEFRLQIVRPVRVSGIIGTADRQLLTGAVILIPRDSTSATPVPPEDVEIQPDGRFVFRNVAPGRYQIRARAVVDPKQALLFGRFAVSVHDRDVNIATIHLVPGAILSGRVEWVAKNGTAVPPAKGLRVRAPFADGTSFGDTVTGEITPDGSFRIDGAMPGRHYLTIEGLPEAWAITSITVRGRDVLFEPADVHEAQQVRDIRIVVSDAPTVLEGTVRDSSGRPSSDALVVAMPPSLRAWSPADPRLRTTRTDDAGRYRVRGLPAGTYQLSAISALDELAAMRREWVERLQSAATRLALAANETRTLDLVARHASAFTRPVSR